MNLHLVSEWRGLREVLSDYTTALDIHVEEMAVHNKRNDNQ